MLEKFMYAKRLWQVLTIVLLLSLILLVFSISYPAARQSEMIAAVGDATLQTMSGVSTSISYLRGDDMAALVNSPAIDQNYKQLSGLLTRIREDNQYSRVYAVTKGVGGKYHYILDAGYRDNAIQSVDYYTPGTEYKGTVASKVGTTVSRIFDRGQAAQYNREIITNESGRPVIVSLLPMRDDSGQVVAVLIAEANATRTDFSKFGPLDFDLLAVIGGVTFAVLAVLFFLNWQYRKKRAANKIDKAEIEKVKAEFIEVDSKEPSEPEQTEE